MTHRLRLCSPYLRRLPARKVAARREEFHPVRHLTGFLVLRGGQFGLAFLATLARSGEPSPRPLVSPRKKQAATGKKALRPLPRRRDGYTRQEGPARPESDPRPTRGAPGT